MTPDEFIREYETSASEHGLEHTLSLIDENAVYWFSNETCHVGKEAIEAAIRHNFETIKEENYRISDVVWLAQSSDSAACIYRFDWSGKIDGAPVSGSGRGTTVLARRGDSWVIVHEHLSQGPHIV